MHVEEWTKTAEVFQPVRRATFCEESQLKSLELAILLAVCSTVCTWPAAQSMLTPSGVRGNKRLVHPWTEQYFFLNAHFLYSTPTLSHCAATRGCSCFYADMKNNNRWVVIKKQMPHLLPRAQLSDPNWVLRLRLNQLVYFTAASWVAVVVTSKACLCCDCQRMETGCGLDVSLIKYTFK